jgi:hypothetical protein
MTRCAADVAGWPGPVQWARTGQMRNVQAFVDFTDDRDPCWRHYPVASALAVLGEDPGGTSPLQLWIDTGAGGGSGEVSVRIRPLPAGDDGADDSVAAIRYSFTFADEAVLGGTPKQYRLLAGLREVRCHPGRGHTRWGTQPCL